MIYADDTQLYVAINTSNRSLILSKLELCTRDILSWCTSNMLSCNPTKTKIAHFMSQFKQYDPIPGIFINGVIIPPVPAERDLGTILDSHLKLIAHVNNICKTAHYAIRSISCIQKYLSQEDCEKLIHAFVTSRLDSCNSILYGLPEYSISKLQRIQNTAARLVSKTKKSDHITSVLVALHWLPIKNRIVFKILLITFKALNGLAPNYICELLHQYQLTRSLGSSTRNLLSVPRTHTTTYGDRAFSVSAPKLWNSLPIEISLSTSLNSFKTSLKTFLFKQFIGN